MRSDVEAAYFTLLRAREDEADLQRYAEYLGDEIRRLRRFTSEGAAAADDAPDRLRRRISHTDSVLHKAVATRSEVVVDELSRLEQRMEAAHAYVEQCEQTHQRLRDDAGPGS